MLGQLHFGHRNLQLINNTLLPVLALRGPCRKPPEMRRGTAAAVQHFLWTTMGGEEGSVRHKMAFEILGTVESQTGEPMLLSQIGMGNCKRCGRLGVRSCNSGTCKPVPGWGSGCVGAALRQMQWLRAKQRPGIPRGERATVLTASVLQQSGSMRLILVQWSESPSKKYSTWLKEWPKCNSREMHGPFSEALKWKGTSEDRTREEPWSYRIEKKHFQYMSAFLNISLSN